MINRGLVLHALALCLAASTGQVALAASYYVSPAGSAGGTGSIASPWDIATAMAHPAAVRPGDTIFLRGGTYRGSFRSVLTGTAVAPITIRPYQGERAIIDGASVNNSSTPMYGALTISGNYAWYIGFEITNTYPTRVYQRNSCFEFQHCRGHGVDVFGEGVKLINLVIHDTSDAIGLWEPAIDAEVNGCIIYYVGNQTETRGHGMGIYAQNNLGTKRILNNIIHNGFHSGIHIYGSAASSLRNVIVEGNTIFQNGMLSADPNGWGIIVGGNVLADTITIRNNYFFNPNSFVRSSNINPSWGAYGTTRLTLTNNDSTGYRALEYSIPPTNSTISGNRLYGLLNDAAEDSLNYAINTAAAIAPATPRIYYRQLTYDAATSYLTIFNNASAPTVRINPAFLVNGDTFEIRDVQNYFGTPLVRGPYSSNTGINVPMGSSTLSQIVGTPPRFPVPTGATFGSFVIRRTSAGPAPVVSANCAVNSLCNATSGTLTLPMVNLNGTVSSTVPESGVATYTFDLPSAATLNVWLRMLAPSGTQDSFYVSIDNLPEVAFRLTSGWSNSLQWRQVTNPATNFNVWTTSLAAGRHTIRVRGREANTGFSSLAISTGSWRP